MIPPWSAQHSYCWVHLHSSSTQPLPSWNSIYKNSPSCCHALAFQMSSKAACYVPLVCLARHSYAEFIVYFSVASSPHTWISFVFLFKEALTMHSIRFTSILASHSNLSLLHWSLHHQSEPSHTPTSSIFCSWLTDNENNLWNDILRFDSPTHTSSHNLTLSPFANFHRNSSWNHSSPPPSLQTLIMSLHYHNWCFTGMWGHSSSAPYFECSTSFHFPFSWEINLHLHLAKSAKLNFLMSLNPKPLSSFSLHKSPNLPVILVFSPFPNLREISFGYLLYSCRLISVPWTLTSRRKGLRWVQTYHRYSRNDIYQFQLVVFFYQSVGNTY